MANIFSIGQSALLAAQAGLSTTGHNIANAATPGFSRQAVTQTTATPQQTGFGFIGGGTQVTDVRRLYSEQLGQQVLSAQSAKSALDSYYSQISRIDNLLADPAAGLSPALQDFFKGIQDLAGNPASVPARQSALSAAETLAARFQSMDGQLNELRQNVNSEITASVSSINFYAGQIAQLNTTILSSQAGSDGKAANDLLDQRDQLIADLGKEVKVSVVKQDGNTNIFIGNGQPLVLGAQTFTMVAQPSVTNPGRLEVGYLSNGTTTLLAENSLPGGRLGGSLDFRSNTLDPAQASLGTLAMTLASTFNAQHRLGQDLNGNLGGDFFTMTGNAAAGFRVAISDTAKIAAAAPVRTAALSANAGSGRISAGVVDASYLVAPLTAPVTLIYDAATNTLDTNPSGGLAGFPRTYTSGATIGFGGISFAISGVPGDQDQFTIGPNTNGIGDNRNALLLGALQTATTMEGGTTNFQGSYAQLVNLVGNKTRELDVTSRAEGQLLAQAIQAQQSVSGVNLDEEATNLLRYQQAYQAAGKVMQVANEMFDVVLSLGR